MLQTEMRFMLEKLIKDKKSFRKLYKSGCIYYSKDKHFTGEVVIVDDRAVIAYLQDSNDENRVIATVNFKENGVQIFKLLGDNWSHHQFGWKDNDAHTYGGFYTAKVHNYDKDRVRREIEIIRKFCGETPKKGNIIKSLSKKKLSKKQVSSLLLDTLDKLSRTRELDEKSEVCPKVKVPSINNTETEHTSVFREDKTPEIQ